LGGEQSTHSRVYVAHPSSVAARAGGGTFIAGCRSRAANKRHEKTNIYNGSARLRGFLQSKRQSCAGHDLGKIVFGQ